MNACATYRGTDVIETLVLDWWPMSPISEPSRANTSDDCTGWMICHGSPVPWARAEEVHRRQKKAAKRIGIILLTQPFNGPTPRACPEERQRQRPPAAQPPSCP